MSVLAKPDLLPATVRLGTPAAQCFRTSRELLTHSNDLERTLASSANGKADHLQALQLREAADGWLKVGLATRAVRREPDAERTDQFLQAAQASFERARALQPQLEAARTGPVDPRLGEVIAYVDGREFGLSREVRGSSNKLQRDGLIRHDLEPLERAVDWRARELGETREVSQVPTETKYIRDRPLWLYHENFGANFTRLLSTLRSGQRWIDVGSGECAALADYVKNPNYPQGAQVKGVDLEHPTELATLGAELGGRFEFQKGNVRDVGLEPASADLITDSIAAFNYDRSPADIVRLYGEALRPGGHAMISFTEKGMRGGSGFVTPDGDFGPLSHWFGTLSGLELVHMGQLEGTRIATLRRTSDPLVVPPLEQIALGKDWTPSPRVFSTPGPVRPLPTVEEFLRLDDSPERKAEVERYVPVGKES